MKMFIAAAGGFLHQDNTFLAVCGEIPDDLDLIVVCSLGMFLLHPGKPGKELPGSAMKGSKMARSSASLLAKEK